MIGYGLQPGTGVQPYVTELSVTLYHEIVSWFNKSDTNRVKLI